MVSLKNKQSGFTIVELLIVIVVIGILAALVITTFVGVQQRARNTERQTDINAIAGQIEAYYAVTGAFPTLTDLNDSTWRDANNFRIDLKAFADPTNAASQTLVGAPVSGSYSYEFGPVGCVSSGVGTFCNVYTLTATLEGGGTYVKQNN
jgi:prepilin-type N-terminal cleavage/methylation domain-containing protein